MIYRIPDQKGLLEEMAKILKTTKTSINVYYMNMANVNTTMTVTGGPYRRRSLIVNKDFEMVKITGVPGDLKTVFDPGHPDADSDGYIFYPNVKRKKGC